MDDRIRVSDADRDRVAARLREHFAAGRLTPDELDERLSAALSAKTFGDLRSLMADLPEPAPVPPPGPPQAGPWAGPRAAQHPRWGPPPVMIRRRGPRVLPLLLLVLLAALLLRGPVLAFVIPLFLVFCLVGCMSAIVAAGRRRHRDRNHRDWL